MIARLALVPALLLAPFALWAEDAKPAEAKPEDAKPAEPPKPKFPWVDATNDLGGSKWGQGGITVVAIPPDTDQVVAGISERWLWTSSNGGQSWAPLASVTAAKNHPYQIVFDPKDANAFWVTSSDDKPGLFTTTDGGKTWKTVNNVEGAGGISVDFSDPKRKTILLGMTDHEHDVQVSSNGGGFFSKNGKLPATTGYTSRVLALDDKTWLVSAAGWDKKDKKEKEIGIWRSDDAGKTWVKVYNNGGTAAPVVTTAGSIFWTYGDNEGILRSTNKGKAWNSLGSAAKCCPMELPKRWLAAVGDQQLVISTDGGDSWDPVGEKLPFQPNGAVWSDKKHCFYAWHSTSAFERGALMRLDVPEDLQELASPTVDRDLVAWDGEEKTVGTGWGGIASQSGIARQGKTALMWHVQLKSFFTNCGWFWGTYPVKPEMGVDASAMSKFVFSMRVDGAHKPTALHCTLHSLKGDKKEGDSKEIDLIKLAPKLLDGQWHDVVVPLADLANAGFNAKQVAELDFTANNGTNEFEFDAYVDNIGFAK
jgi:photosystem II stability/assembly factor-like uncharacterized protein